MTQEQYEKLMEENEVKENFYLNILPRITGKKFNMQRGYGHAEYEIIGGHEVWQDGDYQKLYFHFENNKVKMDGNQINHKSLCVCVKRIGGYDDIAKTTFNNIIEQALLSN